MLHLKGPNGLVNRGSVDFRKMVPMLRKRISVIHPFLQKFAHPCLTRYADYIRFSHR